MVAADAVRGAVAAVLFAGTLPCPEGVSRSTVLLWGARPAGGHTGYKFWQTAVVSCLVSKVDLAG
ncbi:hypothetical protein LBMAG46_39120 [Planctomycetia bacterium]|nr:hypothetical protein LBMAG46_39120 [Planctomycetia bacterium]